MDSLLASDGVLRRWGGAVKIVIRDRLLRVGVGLVPVGELAGFLEVHLGGGGGEPGVGVLAVAAAGFAADVLVGGNCKGVDVAEGVARYQGFTEEALGVGPVPQGLVADCAVHRTGATGAHPDLETGLPTPLAIYPSGVQLFARLVDDAAMFPPGNAPVDRAVAEHLGYRRDWFAPIIGPLVVPDARLADVGAALRHAQDAAPGQPQDGLEISVVNSSGAGGLLALGRRPVAGLQIVAVETALRDLDDLAGNARRVAAAAADLPEGVTVFVEVPYAPGWERAVEVIEEAGLSGKIRTGGTAPGDHPSRAQLAEQLSVLVEADLPFKATAGLHHAWPATAHNTRNEQLPQHGFLTVLIALAALIGGADRAMAADRLGWSDRDRIAGEVAGWDEETGTRVRRRFRSFGCCGVRDPVADLVTLGLVQGTSRAPR